MRRADEWVCIASGPSLTAEDVEKVRVWRVDRHETRAVIVTNTSYRIAPWADVLYAMDAGWIKRYRDDVQKSFRGVLYTRSQRIRGAEVAMTGRDPIQLERNSGAGAVQLAAHWGARRIILLGYDCQRTRGLTHWHGDHPPGLGNARSLPTWPKMFDNVARSLTGVRIINASRSTALRSFPCEALEAALANPKHGITAHIPETAAQD